MAAAPTREELDERVRLVAEAREFDRQARQRRDRIRKLDAGLIDFLGEKDSKRRHGFTITKRSVPGRVSWRDAYVQEVGVEAADELVAEAAPTEKIEVVAP